MRILAASIAALALAAPSLAKDADQVPAPSPNQIVEAAAPEEWITIPAEDLLVMTLAPPDRGLGQASTEGNLREVVIQLMPAPFSQGWVENIRLLARAGWYDGTAVIRVQDNYVTQWGDPDADSENAKPLPDGLKVMEERCYSTDLVAEECYNLQDNVGPVEATAEEALAEAVAAMEAATQSQFGEVMPYDIIGTRSEKFPEGWRERDPYSGWAEFYKGWPIAGAQGEQEFEFWPTHCYGMVGVARDLSPNTGDGSSLYTVIGHAPRHLDRNIALVGRVIEGMEHLSSLPRGKGDLGFYQHKDEQTPILSVRIASDIAELPQPTFEYLSTESETFARYAEARANRRDPFFIHPAGGADICNIPVPVRRVVTD